ncbi:hypothetical protein [Sphingobium limneticum]|uniref:Phage tail protein n=1 Tax=Sphingobium limneticum TaxID=1007511 RepID=A0A5J5I9I4_9SPHN|nr:hypothetical protein [Sphingobium limneticum]KAA9020737.1 hypothetical protein F4U96_03475 [Sphingobium limneticum]KAA9033063.1 hypothetical protein F4U95_03475 [Sphingobium limneticum]
MAIQLLITRGGLDALVNAEDGETENVKVVSVGLSNRHFTMAPTIEVLPDEFKRLTSISGKASSPTIIHMTAHDVSADIYDLRGLGLYLEDGTLFAVYSQADPIFRKVSIASFMLALDIAFANAGADEIVFDDSTFLWPPATEETRGIAKIATQLQVDAGTDDTAFVTALKLAARLAPIIEQLGQEADTRGAADDQLREDQEAITERLDGTEFALAPSGNFSGQGHMDWPVGGRKFRICWGKTNVAGKTATTDIYDAPFSECFGVFQGGGTADVNSTEALRAYPGSGAQVLTHVNLTNGTQGLLTIHWFAIGMAA